MKLFKTIGPYYTHSIFQSMEWIYKVPYLYWIPKLHKNHYKQRYIAGSSKFSTKPLSLLLTKILTAVREKL
jgi:hypothetical protein